MSMNTGLEPNSVWWGRQWLKGRGVGQVRKHILLHALKMAKFCTSCKQSKFHVPLHYGDPLRSDKFAARAVCRSRCWAQFDTLLTFLDHHYVERYFFLGCFGLCMDNWFIKKSHLGTSHTFVLINCPVYPLFAFLYQKGKLFSGPPQIIFACFPCNPVCT